MDLVLAVATGGWFVGKIRCKKGRIVIFDNELFGDTIKKRFQRIAAHHNIDLAAIEDTTIIYPLRGKSATSTKLSARWPGWSLAR